MMIENTFECTRENLTIRGTEYRPEGDCLPAVILCHGIFVNQDRMRHYAKEYAQMGYAAYCFDFCGGSAPGTGKSDGDSRQMSVFTEVKDLEAVMEYVGQLPYTNDTLIIMGNSLGGFVSGLTAAKHPEKVDKLILFYPALCVPDDARAGDMRGAKFDPDNVPEEFMCGPMMLGHGYPEAVMKMDAVKEISAYDGPVLFVHGTADAVVDVAYSQKAHEVMKNSELLIIEGGAHGFSPEHDKIAIEAIHQFLMKQNIIDAFAKHNLESGKYYKKHSTVSKNLKGTIGGTEIVLDIVQCFSL